MRILAVLLGLFFWPVLSAPALVVGDIDTFSGGSLDNWQKGQVNAAFLTNVASGGPAGVGDSYLRSVADGSASFGRLTVFNDTQWTADYAAAGITSIKLDLLNEGSSPLTIRLALRNPSAAGFISTTPFSLGVGSGWQAATFSLTAGAMTTVGAPGTFASFLSATNFALRILHATNTANLNGTPVVSSLGADNVTAVPEPSVTLLLAASGLILGWALVRRRPQLANPPDLS